MQAMNNSTVASLSKKCIKIRDVDQFTLLLKFRTRSSEMRLSQSMNI